MGFEIDKNGSIDPPFLQSEIVNTEHRGGHRRSRFRMVDKSQQRIVAHADSKFGGKPGTSHTTERIGYDLERMREPSGALARLFTLPAQEPVQGVHHMHRQAARLGCFP